jgi:uncharacterized protein YeaO (DUF488 family)
MLKLKRAYEPVSKDDGRRFLVERLWSRGVSKSRLRLRARYFRELDSRPESWRPIRAAARGQAVTLVYSSHDEQHNNAVALKGYPQRKERRRRARKPSR